MGGKQSKLPSDSTNTRDALMNGSSDVTLTDEIVSDVYPNSPVTRTRTVIEKEVKRRSFAANHLVELFQEEPILPTVSAYLPFMLSDAIFVGHLVTDLDSIAGAIGAAELYGGIPARASELNSETKFALNYWGMSAPPPIEELVVSQPNAGICLVDHQQLSQVNKCIDPDRIVGVIDHHALQNSTIVTERPIYIDIRPWGSMSTIIAHTYLVVQKRPRKCVAGMLLCAILSDTLNLLGPTTTTYDKMMVAILCKLCDVVDIDKLATAQFRAKSQELELLTAKQLCQGDMKVFNYNSTNFKGTIGFAVIETTDDDIILCRYKELLENLEICKKESNLHLLYLAVVNIVKLHSNLLILGDNEYDLALKSFPILENTDRNSLSNTIQENNDNDNKHKEMIECIQNGIKDKKIMHLGNRVSRKNDYIPQITKVINNDGWSKVNDN